MEEMIRATVQALCSLKIQYVIIGGIAASIWGRPRMTMDADIVIVASPENVARLLELLEQSGFQISLATKKKLLNNLPAKVRYDKRLSVDLRLATYTLDKQALKRSHPVTLFGVRPPVASAEDIIVYKAARFNDLDKADIKAIILRQKKKLDSKYIVETCQQLIAETRDEKIGENLQVVLSWL